MMKTFLFILSFYFLQFIITPYGFSQTKDFQVWSSVSVKKEITKKLSLQLEEQLRLEENASTIKQLFTELSCGYELHKRLDISGNYRFIEKNEKTGFVPAHRLSFDVKLNQKVSLFTFSIRSRYQKEFYSDYVAFENPLDPTQHLRNKVTIEAKVIKKLSVYVGSELYYQLDNPTGNIFDKARYELGLQHKINKHHFVSGFFMLQKQLNVIKADTDYILGINYKLKI